MEIMGMKIYQSEYLPPDFCAISDWQNAQATAILEWHNIWVLDNKNFVHPSLLKRLFKEFV